VLTVRAYLLPCTSVLPPGLASSRSPATLPPPIRVAGDPLTHPRFRESPLRLAYGCFGPADAAAGRFGRRGVGAAAGRRVPAEGFVDEHHRPTRCDRQPCSTYGVLDVYGLYPSGSEMCSVPCDLQGNSHTCSAHAGSVMITLGVILLIVGFLIKIPILWTIGVIVLIIGLVLLAMGSVGRAVGGRRHYY